MVIDEVLMPLSLANPWLLKIDLVGKVCFSKSLAKEVLGINYLKPNNINNTLKLEIL